MQTAAVVSDPPQATDPNLDKENAGISTQPVSASDSASAVAMADAAGNSMAGGGGLRGTDAGADDGPAPRKIQRRVRGGVRSFAGRATGVAEDEDEDEDDDLGSDEEVAEGGAGAGANAVLSAAAQTDRGSPDSSAPGAGPRQAPASPIRHQHRNVAGRPAEAGVIRRVYVENFMCHRKLTVDLCRNVNFIYGQNGSGKSAILAAVQICLGAGARRTHRARNLRELVRKEAGRNCAGARVRVTVLNRGDDGYRHDVYGESITVERCISLGGGYNGYRLLDEDGNVKSQSKKDLDAMLDQLNIQVENPVAVLDQEEAKKFLCGRAENKYAFFTKATELERMDRCYASLADNIGEIDEVLTRVESSLVPTRERVRVLFSEWKQFQELEKMEDKAADCRAMAAWSLRNEFQAKADESSRIVDEYRAKLAKRGEELEKAKKDAATTDGEEELLNERLKKLTEEAKEAEADKIRLEDCLRAAEAPVREAQRQIQALKKEEKRAEKGLRNARRNLKDTRDEILAAEGSKESDARRRTERVSKAEDLLARAKDDSNAVVRTIDESFGKNEDVKPRLDQAKDDLDSVTKLHSTTKRKIHDLQNSVGNDLAIMGQKVVQMNQLVEDAKRRNVFQGPVLGPIGMHIKVARGKEGLAKIAEKALGSATLERYIVTNDSDRALFMRLRERIKCSHRECNVFQQAAGRRYNIPPPPAEGVETVASVLSIENDVVFNCLVDNSKIDTVALAESKEASERALLIRRANGSEALAGIIKNVIFLPDGDSWSIQRGSRQIVSNEQRLKQSIGVDRTAAIREVKRELQHLDSERQQKEAAWTALDKERKMYVKTWNDAQKAERSLKKKIQQLENDIEEIRGEAESAKDGDVVVDTTELEEDVRTAEEEVEVVQKSLQVKANEVEEHQPAIDQAEARVEEVATRNEKVIEELEETENQLESFAQGHAKRLSAVDKKTRKLAELQDRMKDHEAKLAEEMETANETLLKARLTSFRCSQDKKRRKCQSDGKDFVPCEATDEELEAIKPLRTSKDMEYYKQRIKSIEERIEIEKRKRALSESDPEVAFMKYNRALKDLNEKVHQITKIQGNKDGLVKDAKDRKRRWRQFRGSIEKSTAITFDEILNRKGSAGSLDFDHDDGTLNLVVQKEADNAASQTSDVKALSGGERSFTTLSLLLALGENLETPFRVMDEFDVFLDPVARKIALQTMINIAKDMEHRQFIFITPQDLSSIQTDDKLRIFQMKPPKRSHTGGAQQTLTFGTSE